MKLIMLINVGICTFISTIKALIILNDFDLDTFYAVESFCQLSNVHHGALTCNK